jgi:hypothetical protein
MGRNIIGWTAWAIAFALAYSAAQYGVPYVLGQQSGLTGAVRDSFVGAAIRTCTAQQFNAPANAGIAKPLLISYCSCYANGLADRMSVNQLRENDDLTESEKLAKMKPAIAAAGPPCVAELAKALQNNAK